MRALRTAAAGIVVLAALLLAPPAAADSSPGVTLLKRIPERGIVSARAEGGLLYTSGMTGVSIYDIADPRNPRRIGRLRLPNVQNEDVDAGSGIMLVSDDPLGGLGILHVLDVSDPTRPRRLSTYSTWAAPFSIRPGRRGGAGHTASCIQDCRYAWLAGAVGIEVVDLRDPTRPRFAGRPAVHAAARGYAHDVQVDGQGLAWVAGAGGSAAYDVTNPVRPRLVARTTRAGGRGPWNDFIHHNTLRVSDQTLLVTEEDFGRGGCRRSGSVQSWRVEGGTVRPLDRFEVERDRSAQLACSAHYFDHSNGLLAAAYYEQGLRFVNAGDPARLTQVGWWVPRRSMVFAALFAPTDPAGSVVYAIDHVRGIHVLQVDRSALAPRRRRARRRPRARDLALFVTDNHNLVRRGQRVRFSIEAIRAAGRIGGASVRLKVPRALTGVRAGRGARFNRRSRTFRFRVRRLRFFAARGFTARIRRGARLGSEIAVVGYIRGRGDQMLLDDRGVDVSRVGRRARRLRGTAAASIAGVPGGPPGGVCLIPAARPRR